MIFNHKEASVEALRARILGSLITPDDADYEQSRKAWDLTFVHQPALIVVAENASDIATAVRFADEAGLGVAVQSTGHGMLYPADDNLLIITSRMNAVKVDVAARTAWAEAGALWKHVLDQATPHGLAPLLGSAPHVGIVGYTLGRGIGWLSRKYGFAADSVRSIDIVTADGEQRRASKTENSDLFWGLLGGGGNFGVVTAMEFDLYPVPTVYGGDLTYPGDLAPEAFRFFREWVKSAPDELTSSIAVMKFPNAPFLPEAIRGKIQVIVRAAYAGDAAEGATYIQKWLDWKTPSTNTFHEMPFAEIGSIQKDPVEPSSGYGTNEMVNDLTDELIDLAIQYVVDPASPMTFAEVRHAGGAMARVAPDTNAINHRDVPFYLNIAGVAFTPDLLTAIKAYMSRFQAALRPHVTGGVYLNFMKGKDARERVKDAFSPETYQRLVALKAKYDPDNHFRYSYPLVATKAI